MFTRQKIVLYLLSQAEKPLSSIHFVKLVFLVKNETNIKNDKTFYDFVPYKFGPFSFSLYWELSALQRDGYVLHDHDQIGLAPNFHKIIKDKPIEIPEAVKSEINAVWLKYESISQNTIVEKVYSEYPWYARNSELRQKLPTKHQQYQSVAHAVYTVGYEGKSIDFFLNELLEQGIQAIIDVRANPISRKYGFSSRQFDNIATRLGLQFFHFPELGIPSWYRKGLGGESSYSDLFDWYQKVVLPKQSEAINRVAQIMVDTPAVLVCFEKNYRMCHRSKVAKAVSEASKLEIINL